MNGESYYGTILHEMTHSSGHESRLNRLKPAAFGSEEYAREELVAELGSALLASRYGMAKQVKEESAAYLKSWLGSLKESPEFLRTTLFDVKRATSMISQQIEPYRSASKPSRTSWMWTATGTTQEVAHEERELVGTVAEEHVPYRRGR